MPSQVREKLGLIGLQRTGTNYVQQVLKAAVPDTDFTDNLAWKHAFRDEAGDAPIGEKVVIVARHPVLWLQAPRYFEWVATAPQLSESKAARLRRQQLPRF
jgi:hypothetical protein